MIQKIKTVWKHMISETKKSALKSILEESSFDVNDEIYVKQTWIWGGRIPEAYQKKVLEIFQNEMKIQNEKLNAQITAKA